VFVLAVLYSEGSQESVRLWLVTMQAFPAPSSRSSSGNFRAVVFRLQSFLDYLASHVTICKPATEKWSFVCSFAGTESLDREELERRMTDLARSERKYEAGRIAQMAYHYSRDEASRLVGRFVVATSRPIREAIG